MIKLAHNALSFSFPEVHSQAGLSIRFERTLRIPDDGADYPLPPGLGSFPLDHVDDYAETVPRPWLEHGGVLLPMYQSEALWVSFHSSYVPDRGAQYPFAVKIAAGKINAVTGDTWQVGISKSPQDYLIVPEQPWIDGYCIERGTIRQFVAMPLGSGYSAEEQIRGTGEHGGIQVEAYPMKREVFEKRFPIERRQASSHGRLYSAVEEGLSACFASPAMGLAPGGRMRQEIYEDPYGIDDWDTTNTSRCFVHLANSLMWRAITGKEPPRTPVTAREYEKAGLPWFEYYSDADSLAGSSTLAELKSIASLASERGDNPIPGDASVHPTNIIGLRAGLRKHQVREGRF